MTKKFNAKQFIKKYPKELHPIAEEKMKCCDIISYEWLKKLEKSLKSPFSHIPNNFSRSIEDLVDNDGKLLQNLKRGVDYELVTNFMFNNLSQFSDKNQNIVPREIRCGLGYDPKTGEEVVIFDLVTFNIKTVRFNKHSNSSSTDLVKRKSSKNVSGVNWYASASWKFQDFLNQFCEVRDLDESTHRFYQDLALENPIDLSMPISSHFSGTTQRTSAHDLYFGPTRKSASKGNLHMNAISSKQHINSSNVKNLPNHISTNESSAFMSKSSTLKIQNSNEIVTMQSTNTKSNKGYPESRSAKTEGSVSSSSIDSQDKGKVNDLKHKTENSAIIEYRHSTSNNLVVPKINPTGFVNLSNSCYMNSVIQCFIRIPSISSLYFNNRYASFVNLNNTLSSHGNISKEFCNILNNIASSRYNKTNPYNLSDFRTSFIEHYNTFNSIEQQDAQEFLICLIDGLHEDINQAFPDQKCKKKALETLSPNESPWTVCQKLNKSQIYKIFLGMTETKLTCQICSHVETVKEPFVVLSLPLPSSTMHSSHLEECLKQYCQKEILTKSEKIDCPKCKRKTNTRRVLKIQNCGEILIIALKRFENCKQGENSSFKKNDINVIYPRLLNMNQFSSENVGKYKLIGCVYHFGGLESGHYTACALDQLREEWYVFDDESVRPASEKNIHNRNAYILFYQKE